MQALKKGKINFLIEKNGKSETEFKKKVSELLSQYSRKVRAYLALVSYGSEIDHNVALCIFSEESIDESILKQIFSIFENMFSLKEHLDVIFLTKDEEHELRQISFPFFVSENFKLNKPDFYLLSKEGYKEYGLDKLHACYKVKKLTGSHPDGYLLCNLEPTLFDSDSGQTFSQVVLANRHEDYSLFPVNEWPAYVHVAKPLTDLANKETLNKDDVYEIGWAEIYKNVSDAEKN